MTITKEKRNEYQRRYRLKLKSEKEENEIDNAIKGRVIGLSNAINNDKEAISNNLNNSLPENKANTDNSKQENEQTKPLVVPYFNYNIPVYPHVNHRNNTAQENTQSKPIDKKFMLGILGLVIGLAIIVMFLKPNKKDNNGFTIEWGN